MNIKRILLISNAAYTAAKTLPLAVGDEMIEVEVERKSPTDFLGAEFQNYIHGDTVFVIDVHCQLPGADKLQSQGGIVVYRQLLSLFKDIQDRLKVIFYSPISQNLLVKRLPENYVLKLLPFVECNYDGYFVANGASTNSLSGQIAKFETANWPRFNNASENLLSGWAIANKDKIKKGNDEEARIPLNGMNLLIVDDELSSWALTYQCLFDKTNLPISGLPSQHRFRKVWRDSQGIAIWLSHAEKYDAVLSDLYIEEDHEATNPYKPLKDLEKISGYQLFKALKKKYPYLPYMMFTSSNKVWNAEAFRTEGVWAWAVKETSVLVRPDDKKAQFEHFSANVNKLVDPECRLLGEVWKRLLELKEGTPQNLWWQLKEPNSLKILEECLFILDTVYSQRSTFETKNVDAFEGRLCSVVLNNLGGLCEELEINPDNERQHVCLVASYVWRIRSVYSHALSYRRANRLEVLFCIDLLIGLLLLKSDRFRSLDVDKRIWKDDGRPINANVNYFRQFAHLKANWGVTYVEGLFKTLESKFNNVYDDVISPRFIESLPEQERKLKSSEIGLNNLRTKIRDLRTAIMLNSNSKN